MAGLKPRREQETAIRIPGEDDSGHCHSLHGTPRLRKVFQGNQGGHHRLVLHQVHKRPSQIQLRIHKPLRVLHPDLLVVRDDLLKGLLR